MKNDVPQMHTITKVIQENPTMRTLVFDCDYEVVPGQFVNMWIPRLDEKPFSVAYADGKELHLTIADVGPFSHEATQLEVGDKAGLRGPYGKGFWFQPNQKIAMVGGGFGSAPLHFTALHAVEAGCEIDFIIGARREDLLIYRERVEKLKGATLHVSTDDGSVGHKGYNVQILEKLVEEGKKYDTIMTCGPEVMMAAVANLAEKHKIDAQISLERYMKCGFGLCGQCVVDPTGDTSCTKGPVVSLEYIRKVDEFGKYHRDALGKKHEW
ncbi:MAG: dihydroorotate dehydrogenase electron transfer subunit [Candidatus Gracilibacteria bacterium]|nr:dihydroorotate dehydrogenase electron transfer subunit [Candidatus Gracilibacteria bacterium]